MPEVQTSILDTHIVGREVDLGQLEECLDTALGGERQIVFVSGEPGIGKTTLVDTFVASVSSREDLWIGHGQCIEQYGAGEAYLPILEAINRLCQTSGGERFIAILRQYAPTWLIQLPSLVEEADRESLQRQVQGATHERMLREMADALIVLTAEHGLVIVIEDLHWSDVSTLELLAYLAHRQEAAQLCIIGTYRSAEVQIQTHPLRGIVQELYARGQCQELHVAPLSEEAIATYVGQRLGSRLSVEPLADVLHRRTEGNPLFMVATVEYLTRQGILVEEDGEWTLKDYAEEATQGVPEDLRQLIEKQIDSLPGETQHLLEVASVFGMEFPVAAVAAGVTEEVEDIEQQCSQLARQGRFLQEHGFEEWPDGTFGGRYRFVHTLYQHVLYSRLSEGRRVRLHRQLGERLEAAYGAQARMIAAELSVHFEMGRDYRRAIQYNEYSAQTALQRYAAQEALTHLETGLALLRHLADAPERATLELRLQTSLTVPLMLTKGAVAPETERAYTRARDLCLQVGATPELFPVLYGMARFAAVRGDMAVARELGTQLLQQATQADDVDFRIEAHAAFGASLLHCGEFTLAKEQFDQGLSLYDSQQHHTLAFQYGDDPGLVCHLYMAWLQWLLGYPDQAQSCYQNVHALVATHPYPLSVIGDRFGAAILSQFLRDQGAVQHWADSLEESAGEQELPYWVARARIVRGWKLALSSKADERADGLEQLRHGLTDYQQTQAKLQQTYFLALLAEAYLAGSQIEEGLQVVNDALALVAETGERWWEAELYRLKGELLLAGEVESQQEGEECFQLALEIARRQQAKSFELRAAISLGCLWHEHNRTDEAQQLLEETYSWFTQGFETQDLQAAEALLKRLGSQIERNVRRVPVSLSSEPTPAPPIDRSSSVPTDGPRGPSARVQGTGASSTSKMDAQHLVSETVFRQDGDYWTVAFDGQVRQVKNVRGMRYLAQLLSHPNEELHALTLAGEGQSPHAVSGGQRSATLGESEAFQYGFTDGGEVLDPEAQAAYRKRAQELQEELEEAREFNDLGRVERLQEELDFLSQELSSAVGLGGRSRKTNSPADRARSAVSKAIKSAIKRIEKSHPTLGDHLRQTVRTGMFCSYTPDLRTPLIWQG